MHVSAQLCTLTAPVLALNQCRVVGQPSYRRGPFYAWSWRLLCTD